MPAGGSSSVAPGALRNLPACLSPQSEPKIVAAGQAFFHVFRPLRLASTFGNTVSDPAWKHKTSCYQVSAADRMLSPVNQERMAARLNASHASLASRPVKVAALILEAAGAVACA